MPLSLTRRALLRVAAVLTAAAVAGFAAAPASAQEGPQRVVVIGGVLTEIVYELGVEGRVVAVDTTSVFPAAALAEKPNVGYMRALSAEGVLALSPDLILAIDGAGPPEALDVLRAASIPVVTVPEGYTEEAIAEKIRIVAETFGVAEAGEALIARVNAEIEAVTAALVSVTAPKKVMFVLSFAGGRVMAAGQGTAADAIIALAGGTNAMTGYNGYAPVADEAVAAAAPETILAMANAGPNAVTAADAFAFPALVGTPAAASNSFISFDGQYLLAFGPRTAFAIRDLALALHPDLTIPPLE
ncbi:MAG: heme/hemin ABC transporter substrate-binding protein [Bauldia sp.]